MTADQNAESVVLHWFVADCVAESLAQTADQIGGRMDYLQQTHRRFLEAPRKRRGPVRARTMQPTSTKRLKRFLPSRPAFAKKQ